MHSRPAESPKTLLSRMAATTGIDLTLATRTGTVDAEELTQAIARCAACTSWPRCPEWMAGQPGTARRAPGYCRNRPWLERRRKASLAEALS